MIAVRPIQNRFVIGVVALLVSIIGCQNVTPLKNVVAAREVYTTALTNANTLRKAGKISDTDAKIIEPIRATAAAALDDLETAAKSGTPASYDTALSVALSKAQDFADAVAKHK